MYWQTLISTQCELVCVLEDEHIKPSFIVVLVPFNVR